MKKKNKIRNKQTLLAIFVIVVISLIASFFIFRDQGQEAEAADWFNEAWYYRKTIEIGNATSTLTNFQVKILQSENLTSEINNGKLQADLDDLRFTDQDGNILDYWIEDETATTSITTWVKIPTFINGTSTVYMYYGNSSAEDAQNGNDVFVFFDDFEGDSLNTSKWTISGEGTVAVTDGYVYPSNYGSCSGIDDGWWGPSITANVADLSSSFIWTDYYEMDNNTSNSIMGQFVSSLNDDGDSDLNGLNMQMRDAWVSDSDSASLAYSADVLIYNSTQSSFFDDFEGNIRLVNDGTNVSYFINDTEYGTPQTKPSMTYTQMNHTFLARCLSGSWQTFMPKNNLKTTTIRKYTSTDPIVISPATEEQGPGPVGYWKFDEGYGTTVQDLTPNNNDGTITNATWKDESECKTGKCLYFDGTGDWVSIADSMIDSSQPHTYSIWAKALSYTGDDAMMGDWSGNNNGHMIYSTGGGTNLCAYVSNLADDFKCQGGYIDGQWHHFVIVDDGSNTFYYIDGVLKNTFNSTTGDGNIFYVGTYSGRTNSSFHGYLDELKVYNYARTADEVKLDYSRNKAVTLGTNNYQSLNDGLVGWWQMDEDSWDGTQGEVIDSSGNGNHGISAYNASTTAGKFGNGGSFDGNDGEEYIIYGDTSFLNELDNKFTYSAWVYTTATYGNSQEYWLFSKISTGYDPAFRVWLKDFTTNSDLHFGFDSDYISLTSNSELTEDAWNFITITYDGQEIRTYLNGELDSSAPEMDSLPDSNNSVMTMPNGTMYPIKIDETRIYNRALSPEEVRHLYEWAPGPLVYYKFDEVSGDTAYDSSGNDSWGDLDNAMDDSNWVTKGKVGGALKFEAGSDKVQNSTTTLNIDQGTVMMWYYNDSPLEDQDVLFGPKCTGCNHPIHLAEYDNTVGFRYWNESSWKLDETGLEDNWHHVTITWDENINSQKMFVDGILVQTDTNYDNSWASSGGFWVGADMVGNRSASGIIDEFKLYNYVRSPRQIVEDMNGGKTNNPIAHWSFDEGNGTTAYDTGLVRQITGFGNNGTLTNMSTTGTSTVWIETGKKGNALQFDGINDYVDLGSPNELDNLFNSDFSMDAWVYIPESHGNITIASAYPGSYSNGWHWRISGSNTVDAGAVFSGTDLARGWTTDTVDVGWNHLSLVYNNTTKKVKLYKNTKELTGGTDTAGTGSYINDSASNKVLGNWWSTGTILWSFEGIIDEVKVYNYALTLDEMRQNYNQGSQIVLSKISEVVKDSHQGLVGWWKMDETTWDGTAGEVIDSSGNGNNGTSTNAVSTTTSKYGRAGEFNGTSANIDIADSSLLDLKNKMTLQAWIYPEDISNHRYIISKQLSTRTYSLGITSSGQLRFRLSSDGSDTGSNTIELFTTDISTNVWQLVTATYNGSEAKLFVNGDLKDSEIKAITLNQTSDPVSIGSINTSTYFFDGMIDDVKIYNIARTPEQVMSDYIEGPSPVGYWKMDEMIGTTVKDYSGNGNDLSFQDTPTWQARGKKGSALHFDGTNDLVINTNMNHINSPVGSHSYWLYIDEIRNQGMFYYYEVGGQDYIRNYINGTTHTIDLYIEDENLTKIGVLYDLDNLGDFTKQWLHFVWTQDGTGVKLYINGIERTLTGTNNGDWWTDHLGNTITYSLGSAWAWYKGMMDEVKIWDYALTPRQVMQEYNGGGPIGYWKFDKGEGEVAYDYSGQANNATVYIGTSGSQTTTSTAWTNGSLGKVNGSINFDGTDDYLELDTLMDENDLTWSAWIKTSSAATQAIVGTNYGNAPYFWHGGLVVASGLVRMEVGYIDGNYRYVTGNKIVNDGSWHHIIMTSDSSGSKLYIDGELDITSDYYVGEVSGTYETVTGIGVQLRPTSSKTFFFDGQIDEVRFYNYALIPSEIKKDYNSNFSSYFN